MLDQLIEDLKSDEGFRPEPYQDSLSFWTIGYGSIIDARKKHLIPEHVAEAWLEHDVLVRMAELESRFPWLSHAHPDVRRALGNMAYQLGVKGLANFAKMLAALEKGDRVAAAAAALDSTWAKQTPARAERVAALIRGR
jgi:lysozyme